MRNISKMYARHRDSVDFSSKMYYIIIREIYKKKKFTLVNHHSNVCNLSQSSLIINPHQRRHLYALRIESNTFIRHLTNCERSNLC